MKAALKLLPAEPTPVAQITLVDSEGPQGIEALADTDDPVQELTDALITGEEAKEFAQMQRDAGVDKSADALSMLTLNPVNLQRAREIGGTFHKSGDDAKIGERLLEELVSGEVGIALELRDIEGALASLVGKTVTDPTLVIAVMKALREVIAANGSVRGRMERSLAAAANLRAQRRFLRAQHGRLGG